MENTEPNETNTTITFYCHICKGPQQHMTNNFNCPTCNSGFIEQIVMKKSTPGNQDDFVPVVNFDGRTQMPQTLLPPTSFGSSSSSRNFTENQLLENDASFQMQLRETALLQMDILEREALLHIQMNEREEAMRNMMHFRQSNQYRTINRRHSQPGREVNQSRQRARDVNTNNQQSRGNTHYGTRSPTEELSFLVNENRELINELMLTFTMEEGAPPLSTIDIDRIPTVRISQENLDANLQCHICIELFSLDEEVKKLICNHMYHIQCITPWIRMHATCPICRKSLTNDRHSPVRSRSAESRPIPRTIHLNEFVSPLFFPPNLDRANSQESGTRNERINNMQWFNISEVQPNHAYPQIHELNAALSYGRNVPRRNYSMYSNELVLTPLNRHRLYNPGVEEYNRNMQFGRHLFHPGVEEYNRNMQFGRHHYFQPGVEEYNRNMQSGRHHHTFSSHSNANNTQSDHRVHNRPTNTNTMESECHYHCFNCHTNAHNMEADNRARRVNEPATTNNMESDGRGVDVPATTNNMESDGRGVDVPATTNNMESDGRGVDVPATTNNMESDGRGVDESANSHDMEIGPVHEPEDTESLD